MRILYVEDNDDNIFTLHRRLTRWGHTVLIARDGREGIAMARSERPDLIVMDLSLPTLDGWEATRALKSSDETKHIPILALTAHAMAGDREKALAAGCDDFTTKPMSFDEIRAKIDAVASAPGRSVSESGRLCRDAGAHGRGDRRQRVFVLTTLSRPR